MAEKFWGGLSKVLYFCGALTLILELIVFAEFDQYINTPYWALAGAVVWILFLISFALFVLGANLKNFPAPEKYRQ